MTKRQKDQLLARTLKLVNCIRTKAGMKELSRMPTGKMGDPTLCPLGRALGKNVEVAAETLCFLDPHGMLVSERDEKLPKKMIAAMECGLKPSGYGRGLQVPSVVTQFVDAFDNGELPELQRRKKSYG